MYKIKMLPLIYDTCMYAYHVGVYAVAGRVKEENTPLPRQAVKQIQHSGSYLKILYCWGVERDIIFLMEDTSETSGESIVNAHGD